METVENRERLECSICHSESYSLQYNGLIRIGKFGEFSTEKKKIYCCNKCKSGYLPDIGFDYESDEYRESVDDGFSVEDYWKAHDKETVERLAILDGGGLRGAVVADIGCGAGSFLDVAGGLAKKTIGVEPNKRYHVHLKKSPHEAYQYINEALSEWKGGVDIVTCFAVIEHVENPLQLLSEMKSLLRTQGRVILSTPNYDDWLLQFLPDEYGKFFYRKAHRWYFNRDSIEYIAKQAGFAVVKFEYRQRFDVSNALYWIRDHKPTGLGKCDFLNGLDEIYKKQLEDKGLSDYLYAFLEA